MNVIGYRRVSTGKQEASGLGLEAQTTYIEAAAKQQGWTVVGWYTDVCSGAIHPTERPEMAKAIAQGLPLVAAKIDRFSRDVEHMAGLMKRVQLKVATMPQADNFQLHLFAALAEQERQFISQRTKDALKALEQRSQSGCEDSIAKIQRRNEALTKGRTSANRDMANKVRSDKAKGFASALLPVVEACMFRGASTLRELAQMLNAMNVKTAKGSEWHPTSVSRLLVALGVTL